MNTTAKEILANAAELLIASNIIVSKTQYTEVSMPDHMYRRYLEVPINTIVNKYDIPDDCEIIYSMLVPGSEDPDDNYHIVYSKDNLDEDINYEFFQAKIFAKEDNNEEDV